MKWLSLAGLLLPLLASGPAQSEDKPSQTADHPSGALVDRVVALVENRPITASELLREAEIRERIAASP